MLSSPMKPPWNRLLPPRSLLLVHQVKLMSSLWKTLVRKAKSVPPSSSNTRSAAHACTGGLTSEKFHSYAGICPFGCMYHSRSSRISWLLANSGSMWASVTQWNARSQAAYQGYSHGSGISRTSWLSRCSQSPLRILPRPGGGGG